MMLVQEEKKGPVQQAKSKNAGAMKSAAKQRQRKEEVNEIKPTKAVSQPSSHL